MNHLGTRELATERLTLRRFEIEDAENMFYNWANDPEVTKYLTWPAHTSVEETEEILKDWMSHYDDVKFYQWAIELNELEQPIGSIGVVKMNEAAECVPIGYCIGAKFWNKGYATEAAMACIKYAQEKKLCNRLYSFTAVPNIASENVMKRIGMSFEGLFMHPALAEGHWLKEHKLYSLDL